MLLNELFNQPLPWKWTTNDDGEMIAEFTTDTTPYWISFVRHDMAEEDADLWDVEFGVEGVNYPKNMEVTGSGDASTVFATVIDIIRAFTRTHRAIILVFSAQGASRNKLYDRLTKRLSPRVEITPGPGGTRYLIRT